MKTTTYSISENDLLAISQEHQKTFASLLAKFRKTPNNYAFKNEAFAKAEFEKIAALKACFGQLVRDGLASITKTEDDFLSFADHAGDVYCPDTNSDIEPAELKRQERCERARMNRQGAWIHSLIVQGEEEDSIGGFVGDDFYGSGYDHEFYQVALKQVAVSLPDYIKAMQLGNALS